MDDTARPCGCDAAGPIRFFRTASGGNDYRVIDVGGPIPNGLTTCSTPHTETAAPTTIRRGGSPIERAILAGPPQTGPRCRCELAVAAVAAASSRGRAR